MTFVLAHVLNRFALLLPLINCWEFMSTPGPRQRGKSPNWLLPCRILPFDFSQLGCPRLAGSLRVAQFASTASAK
jgi:hypothetical protein